MEITVFELTTKNHMVMVINWINLCDKNKWKLNIILSEECFEVLEPQLPKNNKHLHIKVLKGSPIFSLWSILKHTRNSKQLILNTIQWHFLFFILLSALRPVTVCIHNSNSWFQSTLSCLIYTASDKSLSKAGRLLKLVSRLATLLARKLILKLTSSISVCSMNIKDHIQDTYRVRHKILVIPFSMKFRLIAPADKQAGNLSVVCPGSVDFTRKNYKYFIHLAENNPNILFYLLGKMPNDLTGLEVKSYIKNREIENILYFDDYLAQSYFDEIMSQASMLYTDINVCYRNEVYGVSKDTGVSYLMAEYNLPLLINSEFRNLSFLNCGTIYFNSYQDLNDKFYKLTSNTGLLTELANVISLARNQISLDVIAKSVKSFYS
jgi:hypothetical protein